MNKTLFVLIALIMSVNIVFSSKNNDKKGKEDNISLAMTKAWLRYQDGDFYGALSIYKEVYAGNENNAMLNFRLGQCYTALNEMDNALSFLEKSYQLDSLTSTEVHFLLGKAYQYNGNLDKAIDAFYKYKSSLNPKQNERNFVNTLLRQCLTAKELIDKPVNAKISLLDSSINSKYTDACPSISADSKTLIFTSRRPISKESTFDYNTNEYFEDVYISTWNDVVNKWNPSKMIGGSINTEGYDANTSISPDGNQIYVYKNIDGETKSGDIYVSIKKGENEWSKSKPLGKNINSTYFESSACVTGDGNTLFFVSEKDRGGFGNGDIYMAKREGEDWGKPVNLGPTINTIDDEIGVYIHPDGKSLFFSSNGHNSMGGYDIFMSVLENGKWSEPLNLGYPINTTRNEIHFTLTTDKKTSYISSSRNGGLGKTDIYEVDMSRYFKSNDQITDKIADAITGPALSILKGTVIDAVTQEPIKTNITIIDMTDNKTTVISSNEKGEYFVTLPADRKYEASVKQKAYKPLDVKFKLEKGKNNTTFTLTKHLLLNKE